MEDVSLFEHNEIALDRLNDALSKGNCATINHATGTGKSFIALKYLYQKRDKNICIWLLPIQYLIN